MMEPLLSVIVPIYNTGKYLRECIDSIRAQTFKDYEIILVNDGSTDNSGEICDEYSKYENVTVIHKANEGITRTRKVGFCHARGKYISYIDSDDTIDCDMYEYMMEKLIKYDADVVICDIVHEIGDIKELQHNYVEMGFYDKAALNESFYPKMLFNIDCGAPGINPSLCNKIIRKSILERCIMGADDSVNYGEDALCTYPCMLDSDRIYVANDKFFYHYRTVNTSLTNKYDKTLLTQFPMLVRLLSDEFEKRNFDAEVQLSCYAARYSMECLRKELLYNTAVSLTERIKIAENYLEGEHIKKAFEVAGRQKHGVKTAAKIKLAKENHMFLLYLSFKIKEEILKIRGYK